MLTDRECITYGIVSWGKGRVGYFYVYVAISSNTFGIVNF